MKKPFPQKTFILGGATAATATTEEFSAATSPHPITPRDSISRSGTPHSDMEKYGTIQFAGFWTLAAIFEYYMVSRRPRRYLKTFLELVASSWLNISPWRAMATMFVPKMTNFLRSQQARNVLYGETRRVLSWETRHVLSWGTIRAVLRDQTCHRMQACAISAQPGRGQL